MQQPGISIVRQDEASGRSMFFMLTGIALTPT